MFAESAATVNRVILQHMSLHVPENTENISGLSPPGESFLLRRRRSLALQDQESLEEGSPALQDKNKENTSKFLLSVILLLIQL